MIDRNTTTDDLEGEIIQMWAEKAKPAIEAISDEAIRRRAQMVFMEVLLSENVYQMQKVLDSTEDELTKEILSNSSERVDAVVERINEQRRNMT